MLACNMPRVVQQRGRGPDLAEKPSLVNRGAENIEQRIRSSKESPDRLSCPPFNAVQFSSEIYQTRFFCQISEVSTQNQDQHQPARKAFRTHAPTHPRT